MEKVYFRFVYHLFITKDGDHRPLGGIKKYFDKTKIHKTLFAYSVKYEYWKYLGYLDDNNQIQWCDEFYNMDWSVKKGAERLGKLVLEENTKIAYDKEMGKRTSVGSGRRPDIENIERFVSYRQKGLSFREIQKLMENRDLKTLYRWDQYVKIGKVKLSTENA